MRSSAIQCKSLQKRKILTQNPPRATSWGFDPPSRHQLTIVTQLAAELFPEVKGLDLTPRYGGKPSIELPTGPMGHIIRSQSTEIKFMVFLNRHTGGPQELVPYRKDVARYFMQGTLYGTEETLAAQYRTIERLLTLDVLELRYTDLQWGITRLQKLVEEGR